MDILSAPPHLWVGRLPLRDTPPSFSELKRVSFKFYFFGN
jgi:hypothetical protein